jgi:hypothetical protein
MPLQSVSTGEVFTVRVYKRTGQFLWANTYEIVAVSSESNTGEAFWTAVANKFVQLERNMHWAFVAIDRVVISSYVPDGTPYNPTSFISLPAGVFGIYQDTFDIVPASICALVRKNVTYGRDGRNLYRGVLSEKDVVGGFPEATLSNQRRTELQNYFNAFYSDFLNDTIFNVCMASGVPNPTNVRIVNNFVVEAKLVSKKTNNRYFKRNPGVPGPDGV